MLRLHRLTIILLAMTLVGAGSCDSDSPTAPDGPGDGDTVTLPATVTVAVGDTVRADSVDVTFSSVTEDSRCPVDVTCVWAGRAVVALAVRGAGGTSAIELEVSHPPARAQGLLLKADALDPQRREGQEIPPEDYRLELSLARAEG